MASTSPNGAPADGGQLIARIEGEYLEMPGLRLTIEQAQRLWALDRDACTAVLDDLVHSKFLTCGSDQRYRRASDGTVQRAASERTRA